MKMGFTHYYFLISCPGDVQEDIQAIFDAVSATNKEIGDNKGIYLETLYWKDDAIPAAGKSAQKIINQQLLKKADGVIALFWTKFGTPTDEFGSGTEEEIVKAIDEGKEVLLYCSDKPIVPSKMNSKQYKRVENFKKNYNGLFSSYFSKEDLKNKLKKALTSLVFHYASNQEKKTVTDTTSRNPLKRQTEDLSYKNLSFDSDEYYIHFLSQVEEKRKGKDNIKYE